MKIEKIEENRIEDEKPFMNISFLNNDVAELTAEEPIVEEQNSAEIIEKLHKIRLVIFQFCKYLANWLKIEKETEVPEETEPVKKLLRRKRKLLINLLKIIKFQLREDGNFCKRKKQTIFHLMTETLANLYVEQRLLYKSDYRLLNLYKKAS